MSNQQFRFSTNNNFAISKIPLPLRALVAEQMTTIRAAVRGLARCRNLEPAFHSLVSLLLGHLFHSPRQRPTKYWTARSLNLCILFPKKEEGV